MSKLILSVCVFILTSCSVSSGNEEGGGASQNINVFTLSWTPPTFFENNTFLNPISDLTEYRIYYGDSAQNVTQNFITVSSERSSLSSDSFDANIVNSLATVHIAMTAVSKDGVESILSKTVQFPL